MQGSDVQLRFYVFIGLHSPVIVSFLHRHFTSYMYIFTLSANSALHAHVFC